MPTATDVTIVVNTTAAHGVSDVCLRSMNTYANGARVLVCPGRKIDWAFESIGHARSESLPLVETEYMMFLDSDDEMLSSVPSEFPECTGLIFNYLSEGFGKVFREFRTNKMCMFATCRTILKTSFVRQSLQALVDQNGVREDVWLMHDLLQTQDFYFVDRYLVLKYVGRCDKNPHFLTRHYQEYAERWDHSLPYALLQQVNALRSERMLSI